MIIIVFIIDSRYLNEFINRSNKKMILVINYILNADLTCI